MATHVNASALRCKTQEVLRSVSYVQWDNTAEEILQQSVCIIEAHSIPYFRVYYYSIVDEIDMRLAQSNESTEERTILPVEEVEELKIRFAVLHAIFRALHTETLRPRFRFPWLD
jgi:hypothetical protein